MPFIGNLDAVLIWVVLIFKNIILYGHYYMDICNNIWMSFNLTYAIYNHNLLKLSAQKTYPHWIHILVGLFISIKLVETKLH